MRKDHLRVRVCLTLVLLSLFLSGPASALGNWGREVGRADAGDVASKAQENFTEGPIWRVVLVKIKPGKGIDFWMDMSRHLKPTFEAYKRENLTVTVKSPFIQITK